MKETKTFHDIYEKIKNLKKCILHCWGVPGSGKSQIVRKLAEKFPFPEDDEKTVSEIVIKWHIQCKDSGHDVKGELKKLADSLFKKAHITNKNEYQSIEDDLTENSTDNLVNTLSALSAPVLIIVEDPDPDKTNPSNILLQDFLRKLSANSTQSDKKPVVHFYFTSRTKSPILKSSETKNIQIYSEMSVTGFNETEALEYLTTEEETDAQAASKIYRRFSGLPLGLQAAKGYCSNSMISSSDYLELLEDIEYDIIEEEKQGIINEFGKNAKHVFQAIVLPFIPPAESDILPNLHWKILRCISYFNYDRILLSTLEYCCHLLRETKVKKPAIMNKADVGKLVSKLRDHDMCSITDEKEITFHEVVFNAFRKNQHTVLKQPFNPIKKAIEVMSGLVSKDMRKKGHSEQMHKLRRHVQCLLDHIEEEKLFDDDEDSMMLRALTSHLYETAAAIMLNESPALFLDKSKEYFKKALELIWKDKEDWSYKDGEKFDPELVSKIVEKSRLKGEQLPENFTLDYASKLELCFDNEETKFLESKSSKKDCFKEVGELIKSKKSNRELLEKLQKCGLFLSNEKYAPIFYAERIASILHSYSRHVLYADPSAVQRDRKCMWMTWLSNCIAVECRKTSGVSLLTEHLSQSGGLIPIVLKLKKKSIDDNVKARKFCLDTLSRNKEDSDMYENGLLKEVFGPSMPSTRINHLRSITRVNARLLKSAKGKVDLGDADKCCVDLLKLSVHYISEISNSIMCIIYCAKYYAARDNCQESVKCFEKFFELITGNTISVRFHVRCWAVCNYARAVCHFNELTNLADKAIKRCEEVLNDKEVMPKELENRLKIYLKELQSLPRIQ